MANPSYKLTGKHPLAYLGVEPTTPPQLVIESNTPKSINTQFNIGTLWVVRDPETVWMLMNLDQGFADWIQLYPASGSGTQFFTANMGMATEVANNINIVGIGVIDTFASADNVYIGMGAGLDGQIPIAATGFSVEYATITAGSGISIVNGANSITIAATGSGSTGNSSLFSSQTDSSTLNNTGGTLYAIPGYLGSGFLSPLRYYFPHAGTLSNLYVQITSNSNTASGTVTVYKNGSPTSIVATITASTTGVYTDTTHTVSVAAGDYFSWVCSQATTGNSSGQITMNFNG